MTASFMPTGLFVWDTIIVCQDLLLLLCVRKDFSGTDRLRGLLEHISLSQFAELFDICRNVS